MAQAMQPRQLQLGVGAAARRPLNPIPNRAPPLSNRRRRRTALVVVAGAAASTKGRAAAAEVVREFYDGVNRRDLAAVEPLIAEGCVYEDLVFPRPMVGRAQVVAFFAEFMGSISSDLRFVIDDISGDDPSAVGVTWHLEWKGRPFPFSRGAASTAARLARSSSSRFRSCMVETAWSLRRNPGSWRWWPSGESRGFLNVFRALHGCSDSILTRTHKLLR